MPDPSYADLPPTQYLIMEVLAARHRLGEVLWTFPTSVRPAMEQLARRQLIGWKSGVAPGVDPGLADGHRPQARAAARLRLASPAVAQRCRRRHAGQLPHRRPLDRVHQRLRGRCCVRRTGWPAVTYRVGNHQPQNVYRDDAYIGVMFTAEDAALVVEALNPHTPDGDYLRGAGEALTEARRRMLTTIDAMRLDGTTLIALRAAALLVFQASAAELGTAQP